MALHKLLVDDFYDASFALLAIHSRLEDYRLAYLLNKHLHLNLKRKPQDLDYNYFAASYAIYEWEDAANMTTWNMVSNVCKREEDALQSSGSLFTTNERVLKTYHLLPEFKKVDYFIKISNDDFQFDDESIIQSIKTIPQIITTYPVAIESIKSKDNLIF